MTSPTQGARFGALVDCAPDAMITTTQEGRIVEFNRAAETLFSLPRAEAVARSVQDFLLPPGTRARREWKALAAAPSSEGNCPGRRSETHMARPDGSSFPVELVVVPVHIGGQASLNWYVHDATDTRREQSRFYLSQWQLRELAGRIEAAREEERAQMAREMHDELGQQMMALGMDVAWLLGRSHHRRGTDPEVIERLKEMAALVESSAEAIRRVATMLRPGILDNLGLIAAIRFHAREFERRSGIHVKVLGSEATSAVAPEHTTAIFRIFQELITNVGRHSGARHVLVELKEAPSHLSLTVQDDGRGIRPEEVAGLSSFGLMGIRERAALLGGTITIGALPGGGTKATLSLPRRPAGES